MNSYRFVIAGTLILAILSVLVFALLNDAGASIVAAGQLIALLVVDAFAVVYIGLLVLRDRRRPRSWLLLFLFTGALMIEVGMSTIAFVLLRRLVGLPPLDTGLGLRLVGIGLLVIAYVPAMKAALFFLVQRDSSASKPEIGDRLEDAP
jgi:amino acid transporter